MTFIRYTPRTDLNKCLAEESKEFGKTMNTILYASQLTQMWTEDCERNTGVERKIHTTKISESIHSRGQEKQKLQT